MKEKHISGGAFSPGFKNQSNIVTDCTLFVNKIYGGTGSMDLNYYNSLDLATPGKKQDMY
jgi:hypothetical protein